MPKDKTKCENQKAKDNGYFIGPRTPTEKKYRIRFIAKLDWTKDAEELAYLNGAKGQCNDVNTYSGSRYCGIAKQLMMVC